MGFSSAPVFISGGRIDTDERRAVVRKLTDALYEYLTLDCTEMERAAQAVQEAQRNPEAFQPPKYATAEMLIRATEELNATREQLEKTLAAVADAPEMMRGTMQAAVVLPLEAILRHQEQRVSDIQADLES